MKILLLSTNSDEAGAPRHVEFLFNQLKSEVNFCVVFGSQDAVYQRLKHFYPEQIYHLKGLKSSISPINDLIVCYRFFKFVKRLRPDVIHCHSSKAGLIARIVSAIVDIPVVYTIHGWPWRGFNVIKRNLFIFIEKLMSKNSLTHYIGVANCVFDEANAVGIHLDKASCSVIHNTVSVAAHHILDSAYELVGDYLVMPARVCDAKDHKKVAMAFDQSDYHGRLVFAGGGTESLAFQDDIFSSMKYKIDEVVFLGERSDIYSIIRNSSGVVLCSHYETFPLTIVEALAFGKPLVASKVGGNGEIIRHEENGLIADSIEDWATCLSKLNDLNFRDLLSRNARATYMEELSVAAFRDAVIRIYSTQSFTR